MAIKNPEGVLVTSDREKPDMLTGTNHLQCRPHDLTPDVIKKPLLKLKPDKASGSNGVVLR